MKQLERVSRWISVNTMVVTEKHSLYYYGEDCEENSKERYVNCFRWNNKLYALDQFLSRWGICGFDKECKDYPDYICGYDGAGNIFSPLLLEYDSRNDKVRLYLEV